MDTGDTRFTAVLQAVAVFVQPGSIAERTKRSDTDVAGNQLCCHINMESSLPADGEIGSILGQRCGTQAGVLGPRIIILALRQITSDAVLTRLQVNEFKCTFRIGLCLS